MVAEVKQGEATTFFKIIKMAENRFKLDFQHCQAGNSSSRMERDNQIPLWPWLQCLHSAGTWRQCLHGVLPRKNAFLLRSMSCSGDAVAGRVMRALK